MQFHYYRRPVLRPRQVAHLPHGRFVDHSAMSPAPGTNQLLGAALPSHPQLERLLLLIHFLPVHLIARPSQDSSPVSKSQSTVSLADQWPFPKRMPARVLSDSCAEPIFLCDTNCRCGIASIWLLLWTAIVPS